MSVPFAIALPGTAYIIIQGGLPAMKGLGFVSWGSMNSFTLTAIPMFIFMAEIMQRSDLSSRIYRGLSQLVSRIPGGLLQTNIAGCAAFAAISGSSVACAASIGSVALPQLLERGYSRTLSAGSICAGGTLGILIPPSLAMIIYGTFTDTSVAKLFMAGVVPGLMLTAMFMLYIAIHAMAKPSVAPREQANLTLAKIMMAFADVFPFFILVTAVLGTMYAGLVTPTEAAAIGSVFAIVIAMVWGRMSFRILLDSVKGTIQLVGNLLFIIYAAYIFSYGISLGGVGEALTSYMVGLNLERWSFFLALFVLYTILGCLVESVGMIVITVPLLYPVLLKYGIDPVWFGIVLVMFIELGAISPPIGINLFVVQSIWTGTMKEVVLGTIPFHLIMFLMLAFLVFWPEIALWLPHHMSGR
ncbi:MAG: dicarboxylate transporter subunit DctM [Alphaproteobacteria bacterium]|nr:dicarboxylate transporter subunit DctM [Alphaproteobacteria bacterium]